MKMTSDFGLRNPVRVGSLAGKRPEIAVGQGVGGKMGIFPISASGLLPDRDLVLVTARTSGCPKEPRARRPPETS